MPPRSRKFWVETLEPLEWQKEILASPPFLIPSDKHQKQKDKDLVGFARSNKHCIHLSTSKTIYFSSFSRPELFCKKVLLNISENSQVIPVNFAKF